jgi:hypothetical protein
MPNYSEFRRSALTKPSLNWRLSPEKQSEEHVCIEDFCGRVGPYYPVQFWADWYPVRSRVEFGGLWNHIPDMTKVTTCPNEKEILDWVHEHDPRDLETMYRERSNLA